jgi:hypothetical protein
MRRPALVPAHMPLAEAARIAERHGFVLESVLHDGRVRIAMVRPPRPATARSGGSAVPPAPSTRDGDGRAASPPADDGTDASARDADR